MRLFSIVIYLPIAVAEALLTPRQEILRSIYRFLFSDLKNSTELWNYLLIKLVLIYCSYFEKGERRVVFNF